MISYSISTRPRSGSSQGQGSGVLQTVVERVVKETQTAGGGGAGLSAGLLTNAFLDEGMNAWHTDDATRLMRLGAHFVLSPSGGKVLSRRGPSGRIVSDSGRRVMRITASSVRQDAGEMKRLPTLPTAGEGTAKSPVTVYFAMMVRCLKESTVRVGFENVTTEGYTAFVPMQYEERLTPTDSYTVLRCQGQWNGTGRLRITSTGDICAYMFILSEEEIDSLTFRFFTLLSEAGTIDSVMRRHFGSEGEVADSSNILTREKFDALISEHFGIRQPLVMTDSNLSSCLLSDEVWQADVPDFARALQRLVVRTTAAQTLFMPGLRADTDGYTEAQKESARALIGTSLSVYCDGPGNVTITGALRTSGDSGAYTTLQLTAGWAAVLHCTLSFDEDGTERIDWTAQRGRQKP